MLFTPFEPLADTAGSDPGSERVAPWLILFRDPSVSIMEGLWDCKGSELRSRSSGF